MVDGSADYGALYTAGGTPHQDGLQVGELPDVHVLVLVEVVQQVAEVHFAAGGLDFLVYVQRQTTTVKMLACIF